MAKKRLQSGQILLIVVLVAVVALTVGLALVSRSLINLRITKQNEQSQQALQAADAGIEQALKRFQSPGGGGTISDSFQNNASYNATIDTSSNLISGNNVLLNGGEDVAQDKGIDVWLSNYPDFGGRMQNAILQLHWGSSSQTLCGVGSGASTQAAMEVILVTGTKNAPVMTRYVYEAGCGRIQGAYTSGADTSSPIGGVQFTRIATIPPTGHIDDGLFMKIIPLYNTTKIGITKTGSGFPNQGAIITSTGTSGEAVRKIQYFYSYPQVPVELFPNAVISQ